MSIPDETSTPAHAPVRPPHEQYAAQAFACPPGLAVADAVVGPAALLIALGLGSLGIGVRIAAGVIAAAAIVIGPGFLVVQPNESRVLILFGRYVGTLTDARLWWTNPSRSSGASGSRCAFATSRASASRSTTPAATRSRSLPSSCGGSSTRRRRFSTSRNSSSSCASRAKPHCATSPTVPLRRLLPRRDLAARQRRRGSAEHAE